MDSDLRRALDRVMAWTTWSSSVGLLENENKIQALAKTKALQSQLQILQPVWTQNKTLSALGVSIRAGPVANTALEEGKGTGRHAACQAVGLPAAVLQTQNWSSIGSSSYPKPHTVGSTGSLRKQLRIACSMLLPR